MSQLVLTALFPAGTAQSTDFTVGRLVEDIGYMADARNLLMEYIGMTSDTYSSLGNDLAFYQKVRDVITLETNKLPHCSGHKRACSDMFRNMVT